MTKSTIVTTNWHGDMWDVMISAAILIVVTILIARWIECEKQ